MFLSSDESRLSPPAPRALKLHAVAEYKRAAGYFHAASLNKRTRNFRSRGFNNSPERCSGDAHFLRRLFMRVTIKIGKPQGLKFIHC
jgi:hypothetical protein